ncbi:NnrU family protein [Gemmobacter denitrificans]|uniref:NnrU family protein n=1 Tax=Gemmobacter denitrificans TaxID=3123040 RepID=A0ABU8BVM4_9RHOB
MEWIEFCCAMIVFLASHRIPAAPGVRARLLSVMGPHGYAIGFSLISVLLLWWLISAAERAPFVPLWDQQTWHRWVINLGMPLAIALAVFGIGAANPFAFEGRTAGFNPDRPGVAGLTRQPLLWSLALWAGLHLLPNGDLAHVMLFAPFLAMALIGISMVEHRRRAAMGQQEWARLTARTSAVPGLALIGGRWRPQGAPPVLRSLLALVTWAVLWHLHEQMIGFWPGV